MIRARQLGALLLLAPCAFAQTAANIPAVPVVTNLSVSGQGAEVRIDVNATAAVTYAKVTSVYGDRIALDLPGVVLDKSARRILVKKNGVHAVRIWQQSMNPPLARMLIELDRPIPYLLSSEGNNVVVRIGPGLQQQEQRASQDKQQSPSKRPNTAAPTGRTRPAVSAAEAVVGIFRRGGKPPSSSEDAAAPPSQSAPQDPPAAPVAQAQEPTTPGVESSKEADRSAAAMLENPAPKSADEPIAAQSTVTAVSAPPASEVTANSSSLAPSGPTSGVPEPVVGPEPAPPALAAVLNEAPAPLAAAEPTKPAREASEAEMRALIESVNTGMRTAFQVKYVQQETAYLDGGRSAGLAEGMTLTVKGEHIVKDTDEDKDKTAEAGSRDNTGGTVAELVVVSVAETSAVTEIRTPKRDIVPGDIAYLSSQDTQALVDQHTMGATRKYPAVISFTESDLFDEEARAYVPRPPLPSVNRARGRIGVDYMGTINRDTSQARSSSVGVVFRADFTRIGGTYWNLSGYWRGRINSFSSSSQQTLQDLLNRTYHLELTYQNPGSRWVAGVGRMYLPWASSLDTIDGGYFGRRIGKGVTAGIFAGSTPDPTSWNYNPDQRLGGTFVNFEGGSFENTHYSSTSGVGVSLLKWTSQRPFVFFENTVTYKRVFSIYHSLQADSPRGNPAVPSPGAGISQSFLTARLSPIPRIELTLNHTYFRNVPTFDPTLIGTGLLDKYLFQGMSAGVRVEVVKQISLYTDMGQSSRTGDATHSLNQLYGVTFGKLPWLGLRADARYSRFNSSFGTGKYRAVSFSRSFGDGFRLDVLGGDQSVVSALAGNQSARFLTTSVDTSLGALFFLQGGLTFYRGQLQNYDQWFFTLGYRFDSKGKHK
jgi:hypothetical protein